MPVTPSYLTFVIDQLASFGSVTASRMFGGIGLYRDAIMFGLIADDVLFLNVDDSTRPAYEQHGMPAFRPVASKPHLISKNYYQVPAEVLDDSELMGTWAARALAAARAKKSAKRAPKKKPPRAKTNANMKNASANTKNANATKTTANANTKNAHANKTTANKKNATRSTKQTRAAR